MSEIRSQATPAKDLETQLRDALYKAGRKMAEHPTAPNLRELLQRITTQGGSAKLEEYFDKSGNSYANTVLPTILPIIKEHAGDH